MQLKKQLWKKLRNVTPCVVCNEDHESARCVHRRGKRKLKWDERKLRR